MTDTNLPPELERRIAEIETQDSTARGLTGADWLVLLGTGVALPILVLIWGAM
ncbi:MAG: hypothetical protein AAFY35_13850 [Pseudomonadota bacterium]